MQSALVQDNANTAAAMYFSPCRRATFLSCTYAAKMRLTWRELDLGHWKQSVPKDFLHQHSAPVGPASRERPG